MRYETRAIEKSKAELTSALNQLEADMQEGSCSLPEHEHLKQELAKLLQKNSQLEKQHGQQSIMLAQFQDENKSLEVRQQLS